MQLRVPTASPPKMKPPIKMPAPLKPDLTSSLFQEITYPYHVR